MIVKLLTEHHLEFLSLKGGYTGSSESTHVKMPHCWKSHALAHIMINGAVDCVQVEISIEKSLQQSFCVTTGASISIAQMAGYVAINITYHFMLCAKIRWI